MTSAKPKKPTADLHSVPLLLEVFLVRTTSPHDTSPQTNPKAAGREARGGKKKKKKKEKQNCSLKILGQFQEPSFSLCQQHPSIPIATSPRLSNLSKREAHKLQQKHTRVRPETQAAILATCWVLASSNGVSLPPSSHTTGLCSPLTLQADAQSHTPRFCFPVWF